MEFFTFFLPTTIYPFISAIVPVPNATAPFPFATAPCPIAIAPNPVAFASFPKANELPELEFIVAPPPAKAFDEYILLPWPIAKEYSIEGVVSYIILLPPAAKLYPPATILPASNETELSPEAVPPKAT